MNHAFTSEHLTEALARANQHWQARHEQRDPEEATPTAFTIAINRETGTFGAAIAREVAKRLGWPMYDRALLQRIADDMGVHGKLLESVDERREGWVSECVASLFAVPRVNEVVYFRRLVEALLSLAAHGECVIVGRGATNVLPMATTLRVRVVAPLEHRIQAVQREDSLSHKEAIARVKTTDEERNRFITSHFQVDPADPTNYDLVLNVARFTQEECADFVIAALDRLRTHQKATVSLGTL